MTGPKKLTAKERRALQRAARQRATEETLWHHAKAGNRKARVFLRKGTLR